MSTLPEIKLKLDSLGTLGTLKIGFMPATPDAIGVLYEYGGFLPNRGFGVVGVLYEWVSFQLAFRGSPYDYSGPRAKAEIAYRYLVTLQPGALGATVTTNYLKIDALQPPHPVAAVDSNNRHSIGVNFRAMKELSV